MLRPRPSSLVLSLLLLGGIASAADHVVLQLGWSAEPEFGGFFAAKLAGLYARSGLDVDIVLGNAQVNATQLLLAGRADFIVGPNTYALNALRRGFPLVVVAAIFQKSPNALISHTDVGNDSLQSLKGKPIMIAFSDIVTFWPFLKQHFGFDDAQLRPYNFNSSPFLVDPGAIQQGYVTEEPYVLRAAGASINVFPLADSGYDIYGATLMTTPRLIAEKPALVARFVNASLDGWRRYLGGDGRDVDDFIKKNNPQITDGQIAFALEAIKQAGLVDSGDAREGGIGAMSDQHWARMFGQMAALGQYPPTLNYRAAYTLQFVGHGKAP